MAGLAHRCGDLYLQHLTAKGIVRARLDRDRSAGASRRALQTSAQICSDGAGGVFIAWSDNRSTKWKIYTQRITPSGTVAPGWPATGLQVANDPSYDETAPRLCADSAGGAYVGLDALFSGSDVDVRLTRVNPNATIAAGFPLWIDTSGGFQQALQLASDGAGGVFAAYGTTFQQLRHSREEVFGRRPPVLDFVYGPYAGNQREPQLVADGLGGDAGGLHEQRQHTRRDERFRLVNSGGSQWVATCFPTPLIRAHWCRWSATERAARWHVLSRADLFFSTTGSSTTLTAAGTIATSWRASPAARFWAASTPPPSRLRTARAARSP